mmetsp:Transcript_36349/g.91414  ORF Transcript_36349/g.91414 Transcript_36349/m.91414 type:complete len:243 (-) Transcript_36349:1006-1734(-)
MLLSGIEDVSKDGRLNDDVGREEEDTGHVPLPVVVYLDHLPEELALLDHRQAELLDQRLAQVVLLLLQHQRLVVVALHRARRDAPRLDLEHQEPLREDTRQHVIKQRNLPRSEAPRRHLRLLGVQRDDAQLHVRVGDVLHGWLREEEGRGPENGPLAEDRGDDRLVLDPPVALGDDLHHARDDVEELALGAAHGDDLLPLHGLVGAALLHAELLELQEVPVLLGDVLKLDLHHNGQGPGRAA